MAYSFLMQILTDPIARQDIAIGQTGLEGPIDESGRTVSSICPNRNPQLGGHMYTHSSLP